MEFLRVFFEAQKKVKSSDLHLYVGYPPHLRGSDGNLYPIEGYDILTAKDTNLITEYLLSDQQYAKLQKDLNFEFSGYLEDISRFRVNFFYDSKGISMVFRMIANEIPTLQDIGAPDSLIKLAQAKSGIILITGPNASGKTTTMAALIDEINATRNSNIISIEDPIEIIHKSKKSIISQREVGNHVHDFKHAAKYLFRQDVNVVAIGEMRDAESFSLALDIAESGHLIISSIHADNVVSTITRIIGSFSDSEQNLIRMKLANSILGIVSQKLIPLKDGSDRVLAAEVLLQNDSVRNAIVKNNEQGLKGIIENNRGNGMQTFDDSLIRLYKENKISKENAVLNSTDFNEMVNMISAISSED